MSIEEYFRTLQHQIEGCPTIVNTIVTYEKRDPIRGFVRGELFFIDGSMLHFREFAQVADGINRQTYAYQYMAEDRRLIFRYDNADHYGHLNLPSHPHHKHDHSETQVVEPNAPTLVDVLTEIEQTVKLN